MLASLSSWLYISFLCWSWGVLALHLIKKTAATEITFPHFSIICITGLSAITIVAGIFSLFIPLGDWWVQFLFIIPGLAVFFIKNVPVFFSSLKKDISFLHITSFILLLTSLLLILVMSSWTIVHPDTLGYHAQTMQWIEKYKAVPGLVHLHVRFGYQGLWFVDSALFDLSFIGKQGITFLNSTVLFWFLSFIVNRIDYNFFQDGRKVNGLLWLALLSLSFWSYTQIRLTATSASPDFIATIFVLAIIYLLIEKGLKHLPENDWLLAAFLSIVAVTIKLSVAPILIIAFVASILFIMKRRYRSFLFIFFIAILSFSGFIARNIITSGYIVFPSAAIDIANVDWKYSKEKTAAEKDYITAYAKSPGVTTIEEINATNRMNVIEWFPNWWKNRSVADKSIITLLVLSLLTAIVFLKKILISGFIPLLVILTMLTGIVFWFLNAPDPRFGFGFILGLIAIITFLLFKESKFFIGKNTLVAIIILSSLVILAYTGYRFKNFFYSEQLLTPIGIPVSEYKTFDCEGVPINSPVNAEFGVIPVPCSDLDCENFSPRGDKIEDGFKAK